MRILVCSNGCGEQLYGKKAAGWLPPHEAQAAINEGYHPYSYQAVLWFTFFFVPIVPLGVYRVLEAHDTTFGGYRLTPVAWDWRQVMRHYLMALFGLACIPLALVAIVLLAWGLSSIAPPMTQ
ncbi:MAG TPA: hypothetical protein VFV87_22050 [Pirellulaceae bacterium]|nr:hypothetical protein [Pirellulaceae bacterium]